MIDIYDHHWKLNVTVSVVDLQLISLPSASPGSPPAERVMARIKFPLLKADGDTEAHLGSW